MKSVHRTKHRMLAGVFVAAAAAMVLPVAASAKPSPQVPQRACDHRDNNSYSKLLECVRLNGVREHQAALQAIADANGGTRADQTQGHLDSVEYVYDTMTAAGWDVEKVPFEYPAADILVEQVAPLLRGLCRQRSGRDRRGRGDGRHHRRGRQPHAASRPGDERVRGRRLRRHSLVGQHRTPPARHMHVRVKVANAQAAGASAVIIFNQGNTPARTALDFRPTLGFQAFDAGRRGVVPGRGGARGGDDRAREGGLLHRRRRTT